MKSINDILFVIQARLNSQRVPKKMIKDFNGTNLFSVAIDKVLESKIIPKDNFYVSICEDELIDIANDKGVNIYNRSYESANNDNSLQKIYEWHDKLPFKYVVKINGCSPLLKTETIDGFVKKFVEQEEEYKDEIVEGKKVKVYKPRVEVTIKNLKNDREYLSDAEAQADVDSAVTDTKQEDISRNVNVIVGPHAFGSKTNI